MEKLEFEMKKPERIFNFDSGWSIDLDRVIYIGLPEIKDGRLTLKIGVPSSNARGKNSYLDHEETIQKMDDDLRDELYKSLLLPRSMEGEIDRAINELHMEDSREGLRKTILSNLEHYSNLVFEQFCFHDFKYNCEKFRQAWKEWITYKEYLEDIK